MSIVFVAFIVIIKVILNESPNSLNVAFRISIAQAKPRQEKKNKRIQKIISIMQIGWETSAEGAKEETLNSNNKKSVEIFEPQSRTRHTKKNRKNKK